MTFAHLTNSMRDRSTIVLTDVTDLTPGAPKGRATCAGIVSGIQAEDGSGRSWIVTLAGGRKLYLRTAA